MPFNYNIKDPDYSIFNAYNFFIGGDYTRMIILIYIFLCITLNILIYISIYLSKKKIIFCFKDKFKYNRCKFNSYFCLFL